MALDYLKDPAAIYHLSFETARAEADLSGFTESEAQVAMRVIHACGMPEIARDLKFSNGAVDAATAALAVGAPILCDCTMVAAGISLTASGLNNPVLTFLDHADLAGRAKAEATTRSAAQVPLWRPYQAGAIIAIGNAPTALFRLIEEIQAGAPMPAVVLGFPVGFVGAAESKQALTSVKPLIPHLALLGRRGGSAIAAAAVNALARIAAGRSQI
ncbi:MAG: precorrin-8X methylmutase [Alphaproteobacteria bacterium]|nr:precorrin-8X methylmutase [Alphaproteobacteria bacterium]